MERVGFLLLFFVLILVMIFFFLLVSIHAFYKALSFFPLKGFIAIHGNHLRHFMLKIAGCDGRSCSWYCPFLFFVFCFVLFCFFFLEGGGGGGGC